MLHSSTITIQHSVEMDKQSEILSRLRRATDWQCSTGNSLPATAAAFGFCSRLGRSPSKGIYWCEIFTSWMPLF